MKHELITAYLKYLFELPQVKSLSKKKLEKLDKACAKIDKALRSIEKTLALDTSLEVTTEDRLHQIDHNRRITVCTRITAIEDILACKDSSAGTVEELSEEHESLTQELKTLTKLQPEILV